MIKLDRSNKTRLVDHMVHVLTSVSPDTYNINIGEWFFINKQGNVQINLRNISYSLNDVIKAYVAEYNPSWYAEFYAADMSDKKRLAYQIYELAMGRRDIKEYKLFLKKEKSGFILSNYKKELVEVNHKLENVRMRKTFIESQIKELEK